MSRDDNGRSAFGGLLLGALGGAVAVILSDPKKRQRISQTLSDWINTSQEKIEDTANKGRKQLAGKLDEMSEKLDNGDNGRNKGR